MWVKNSSGHFDSKIAKTISAALRVHVHITIVLFIPSLTFWLLVHLPLCSVSLLVSVDVTARNSFESPHLKSVPNIHSNDRDYICRSLYFLLCSWQASSLFFQLSCHARLTMVRYRVPATCAPQQLRSRIYTEGEQNTSMMKSPLVVACAQCHVSDLSTRFPTTTTNKPCESNRYADALSATSTSKQFVRLI